MVCYGSSLNFKAEGRAYHTAPRQTINNFMKCRHAEKFILTKFLSVQATVWAWLSCESATGLAQNSHYPGHYYGMTSWPFSQKNVMIS